MSLLKRRNINKRALTKRVNIFTKKTKTNLQNNKKRTSIIRRTEEKAKGYHDNAKMTGTKTVELKEENHLLPQIGAPEVSHPHPQVLVASHPDTVIIYSYQ